jgi:four helix bundle protein
MANHWKDLVVWQKSHAMVKDVYKLLLNYPTDERYCLIDQIRRASVSVATNIVEGHSKPTQKDFTRFLYISRGSLEELRYLLLLSSELGFIPTSGYTKTESDCKEISLILNALIKSIDKR